MHAEALAEIECSHILEVPVDEIISCNGSDVCVGSSILINWWVMKVEIDLFLCFCAF